MRTFVIRGGTPWTGDFKCREVKTGFCRNRSMQAGCSGTLIGWKSGQTTYVPLWDRMEGAWLWTLGSHLPIVRWLRTGQSANQTWPKCQAETPCRNLFKMSYCQCMYVCFLRWTWLTGKEVYSLYTCDIKMTNGTPPLPQTFFYCCSETDNWCVFCR